MPRVRGSGSRLIPSLERLLTTPRERGSMRSRFLWRLGHNTARSHHLAAHQAGLRGGGSDAFAHQSAAQRPDAVDQKQREPARALRRKKIREQAAVQQIDRNPPAGRVGPALGVVAREQARRAEVEILPARVGDELGERCRVAQAEIEALRAKRRHHVRRLADQRNAPAGKGMRGLDRERKHAAALLDAHRAEQRMRAGQVGPARGATDAAPDYDDTLLFPHINPEAAVPHSPRRRMISGSRLRLIPQLGDVTNTETRS